MEDFVISPIGGQTINMHGSRTRLYANPHFDYLSEMLPRNIHDLFKWCELIYNSMPSLANSIKKLSNYSVTDFSYDGVPDKIREDSINLADTLKLKNILLDFNIDYFVYGNVFRSVYMPFKRFLICKNCGRKVAIEQSKFTVRNKKVYVNCTCGKNNEASFEDVDTFDLAKIRIVKWDPKSIELSQNPITGATRYFYQIPADFVKRVQRGDPTVFYDTPKVYIDAALKGRNVELGTNFYAAKCPGLAGYQSGWGVSPIMPTLKLYSYIAILRRAAEAVSLECITPQRIVYPQSTGNDPSVLSSMKRWHDEVRKSIDIWRRDPGYIMLAPYSTGVTDISSQGKQVSLIEEIKDARMEMGLALDIPPNILTGDATIQNSTVGLRLLEIQLTPQTQALESFIQWLIDKINGYLDKEYAVPKLVPFNITDDLTQKQLLLNLTGNGVSKTTMLKAFNLDPDKERDLVKQDAINDQMLNKEVQDEINKRQNSLSEQVKGQIEEANSGMPTQYNQQKMLAQAQQVAGQLLGMPYEQRKSQLIQLQQQDYVMWSLVSHQMDAMRRQQGNQQQGQQQAQ